MNNPTSPMQRCALPQKHFNNAQMEKDTGEKKKIKTSLVIQLNLKNTFKMWKTAPPTSFL